MYVHIASVNRNSHNFRRPVEGAMKLLRTCFSSFLCIFYLAKHNNWNCSGRKYLSIAICI